VYLTTTVWPDIIVGLAITGLFLRSSIHVLRQAAGQLRASATGLSSSADRAA